MPDPDGGGPDEPDLWLNVAEHTGNAGSRRCDPAADPVQRDLATEPGPDRVR